MADNESTNTFDHAVSLNKTWLARAALCVGSALIALVTLGWAGHRFWLQSQAAQPALTDFLGTLALLFTGLAGSLLLWGLAEILHKLDMIQNDFRYAQEQAFRRGTGDTIIAPLAAPIAQPAPTNDSFRDLTVLMKELRDISLLTEGQRVARLEVEGRQLVQRLEQAVPALVREHNWAEARRRVQEARLRFPMLTQWDALDKQIEAARAKIEAHDVEAAARQINDLIALKAWQRATEVIGDLLRNHPNSAGALELDRRVAQERDKAELEERTRLMARAQNAADQHDWTEALAISNTLIQQYPRSMEADALRMQLPTLQDNLEIQTRHRMEAEFRELYKEQRYEEALEIAREFLERYPSSPQAQALRDKIAVLEQKAVGTD